MKILIIGGNRFVGLQVSVALDASGLHDLHIFNRTGQVGHVKNATIHKGDRGTLHGAYLDKDWDVVLDFAAYTGAQARETLQFFRSVKRYICVSSSSVYDELPIRREADFDPATWTLHDDPTPQEKDNLYQFGKREVEAEFTQSAKFPIALIRFPFILGSDDYTRRLDFHYERVRDGQPIFMPNPKAKISVVHSVDAAKFLLWAIDRDFTGPLNVASPEPLSLDRLLSMIEASTGRRALLIKNQSEANHSPYGVATDGVEDVTKLKALGYVPKALDSWLPELIASLGTPEKSGRLH